MTNLPLPVLTPGVSFNSILGNFVIPGINALPPPVVVDRGLPRVTGSPNRARSLRREKPIETEGAPKESPAISTAVEVVGALSRIRVADPLPVISPVIDAEEIEEWRGEGGSDLNLMGNCLSGQDPWSRFKHSHLALGKVIVQSSRKKKPAVNNNSNEQNVPVSTDIGSTPASSNIVSAPLTSTIGSVPATCNYVTAVEAPKDIGDLQQITSLRDLSIFTYKELTMATDYFRPDLILGEGGFGLVFKGVIDEKVRAGFKSVKVAVKELNPDGYQGDREWLAEVNYLGQFSHPNLVRLIGYCYEDKHRLLVYEYMASGNLETHLFRRHNTLTWPIRMKIALDAAKGLAFLHGAERPIIYRDFKTSNILLDAEFNAKLSDFGLAKEGPIGDQTHVSTRVMGTYGYAAPEYIMTGHLTAKSDVYGFGVVLLEIIVGKRALDKRRPDHERNLVEWARPLLIRATKLLRIIDPKVQGQYSSKTATNVGNLAHRCLSENPKFRPTMKEVVETLETYNQEEMIYQRNKAAGIIQEGSEETLDGPDAGGQQAIGEAKHGEMETVVHGGGEIKQGNGRSRSDPPSKEPDHHKHCPPSEPSGGVNNSTHARPPPECKNYER